jgi:ATP-binding cassette subfamily B protein
MPRFHAQNYEFTVRSCVPGRIRWHVPGLIKQAPACRLVCSALAAVPEVSSAKVDSLTGSVLVKHELPWDCARLSEVLSAILARIKDEELPPSIARVESWATDTSLQKTGSADRRGWSSLTDLLAQNRGLAWKALGATFGERLFEASPPALISLAVDSVSRKSQSTLSKIGGDSVPSQLRALLAAGTVVWAADSAAGYYKSVASANLSNAVWEQLRNELYQHFQTLDLAQIESELPGYWESIFQDDTNTVAKYLEEGIDPIVSILVNAGIVAVQLLSVSIGLALFQLVAVPGIYLISKSLLPALKQRRKLADKAEGRLGALLRSNVQGISTIASFARENDEAAHVALAGAEAAKLRKNAYELSASYVPMLQLAVGVSFLGTLAIGGSLVHRGKMVAGQLSMIGFSSLRLLTALGYLGITVDGYQKARMAMQRIEDFRARTPQIESGPYPLAVKSVRGEFKLERVTFGYPNEQPLFKDLSLSFPAGETIGLVGLSGAGKSTLLKLLLRYYDVSSGDIKLDGRSLKSLETQDLRRSIAYVPQQPFIFPGTVRENVAYSHPSASLDEVVAAAKMAMAHEFIEQLPRGYDTIVRGVGIGGEGQALSGGQAQRLAIARAALADTPIILFDEATSAVDNETESAIQRSLHDFSAGRTTIIVAHRLSTVRRADRIYVLDHGTVRETGTHDELVARNGMYAGFWRVQTGEAAPSGAGNKSSGVTKKRTERVDRGGAKKAPKKAGAVVAPKPSSTSAKVMAKTVKPAKSAVKKKGSGAGKK